MARHLAALTVVVCALALPAAADLVGYWTFDNPANLGQDTSAQANQLNTSGTPTYTAAGRFGGAVDLDGAGQSDALVQGATFPTGIPTGNSSYTLSVWINPDSSANNGGFTGWGNYGASNQVNAFRMNGNGGVHHYWWSNDLGAGVQSGDLLTGWHHVAAVYDAATGRQQIFIDGAQRNQRIATTPPNVQAANFAIGKTFGSEYLDGQLDEVAVFNAPLRTDQIKALAAGTARANAIPATSSLAGLWRFDSSALGMNSVHNVGSLATYGNAVTQDPAGRYGSALRLGGSDDYLALPGDSGGDFPGLPANIPFGKDSYTIAAWIKPDASAVFNAGFVGWGNYGATNQVNAFRMDSDDGLHNYWWANDFGNPNLGVNFKDGLWHHVAVAYDSITGNQVMYIDGLPVLTATGRFNLDVRPENFRIGTTNGLAEDFTGLMDDVAIFNAALTADQIRTIMTGNFSQFEVPEPCTLALLLTAGAAAGPALRRRLRRG